VKAVGGGAVEMDWSGALGTRFIQWRCDVSGFRADGRGTPTQFVLHRGVVVGFYRTWTPEYWAASRVDGLVVAVRQRGPALHFWWCFGPGALFCCEIL